jgi:hypothetical protein
MSAAALPLARVEARRLARHPLLGLGVLLSLILLVAASGSNGAAQAAEIGGMGSFPLAAGTLLAANAAALRSRRDGTDELFSTLPGSAQTRTSAQLLALLVVVPIAAALVGLMYVAFGAADGLVIAQDGRRHVPVAVELAQGPVAILAMGALGILLGRRMPSPLVAAPVVVALLALEIPLAVWGSHAVARWALPFVNDAITVPGSWVPCEPGDVVAHCSTVLGFDLGGMAVHLAYLALTAALCVAGALLPRHPTAAAR